MFVIGFGREIEVMSFDREKHHRRSIRLPGYSYIQAGAYFVTVCTQDRECFFGEIVNAKMELNQYGAVSLDVGQGWIDNTHT